MLSKKPKMSVVIGKASLMLKLFNKDQKHSIKNIYNDRLEKLFSHPPSNFGYKSDIEGILNELALKKEQLLYMVVNSLGRSTRTKPEIRLIASYLFLMQDFLKLIKARGVEEKENLLLKDMLTLAESVDYQKEGANVVLMRYGEKGNNAYIILDGKVDVLIESSYHVNLGEKTYLYYLANLIKYHEFGLVNSVVNENFKKFPMEIIDDITIRRAGNDKHNKKNKEFKNNIESDEKESEINALDNDKENSMEKLRHSLAIKQIQNELISDLRKKCRNNTYRGNGEENKKRKKQLGVFRLNYVNEEFKELKNNNIPSYSAKGLLNMFGLKLIDKRFDRRLNHVDINDYIKRLNILKDIKYEQIKLDIKKEKEPKIQKNGKNDKYNRKIYPDTNNNNDNNIEQNNSSSSSESSYIKVVNENILDNIKLYTYTKIISLERGSLFGDMALSDSNALRKATIITSSDCHFAILNKKTFNNCIKMGAQKHLKETLQFFIEIPIFSGIPEGVFYNKYYTNLSKITIVKGKTVINQGEKPEHITLLQTGSYGLTTRMSLYDLTRLILHYADYLINKNNPSNDAPNPNTNKEKEKEKNNKNNTTNNKKENKAKEDKKKEEKKNSLTNANDIQKLISEESTLLNESISFKKYYYSTQYLRISEIYCPEVVLNDEFLNERGFYAFTIEAKAPENIIYTLNNKFLVDINEKNISIQKNREKFLKQKMNVMVKRLLIIRNSLINSFFDSKAQKEIGEIVIKELEENILINSKKKRVLNKKEKIIIKNSDENDKKEKLNHINITYSNSYFMNKTKNTDNIKYYRNTENTNTEYSSNNDKLKNQINSFNNPSNKRYIQSIKENKNKIRLKPLEVSLKQAIKFTNHYLNQSKKDSPNKRKKSTYLQKINNTDGLLFSLNDNDKLNSYNSNFEKTSYNISRNKNNAMTESQNRKSFNPFPFSYNDNSGKNINGRTPLLKTKKFLINKLIWENMKSEVKFPIKLNINDINNYEEDSIKTNYHTYYGHKAFLNQYKYKQNKNLTKSHDNKFSENNLSLSKDFSFNNIQIETQNNFCFLSTQSKIKKSNASKKKNKSQSPKKSILLIKSEMKPNLYVSSFKKNEFVLKMKKKKMISPQEINLMRINRKMRFASDGNKSKRIKEEKFNFQRNNYFKKNIFNRIQFFYGKTESEKKN